MQEHRTAIEADLIRLGVRLREVGSEGFTWLDLRALLRHPAPGSAFYSSFYGHSWTVSDLLAAAQLDALNGVIWQNGGGKGPKPKPVERPKALTPKGQTETRKLQQGDPMSLEAAKARLEARNGR